MRKTRFVMSLVAALSFSTLALANSAPVNINFHSIGTANIATGTAGHLVNTKASSAPMVLGHVSSANSSFAHGTPSRHDGNWSTWHIQPKTIAPLSAPEPSSLLLLSTGLIGIAGTVRRKLQR